MPSVASTAATDLLIHIRAPREAGGLCQVEASIDNASFFYGGSLALDPQRLRATQQDNRAYGAVLEEALFSEPIARAYHRARGIAGTAHGGRLRLRLLIDPDVAYLHALRWERLSAPGDEATTPFSVAGLTPFSRFIEHENAPMPPLTRRPLRLVLLIANPSNLPEGLKPIDIETELKRLAPVLKQARTPGKLHIRLLPGISGVPDGLRAALEQDGIQIQDGATTLAVLQQQLLDSDLLHFLGHGIFIPGEPVGTSALYLERTDGRVGVARDDAIVARLGDAARVPRLVFLAACDSARRSPDQPEPFVGLAPKLVRAGVPAVIGMQDQVPMTLARQLTGDFYQHLLTHGVIDQALNDARLTLYERRHADWSIPVLFSCIRDGRLFAPDPLRVLLRKTIDSAERYFADKEPPLPLDVARASAHADRNTLLRLESDSSPGDDCLSAIDEVFASGREIHPCLAVLLGGPGTAKSTQMRYITGYLARQALATPGATALIPVYVAVDHYFKLEGGFQDSFSALLLHALRQRLGELDEATFEQWLNTADGPRFLFLLDGSDRLDERARATILEQLGLFATRHERHGYLLACDLSHFSALQLPLSDHLVIKPMRRARLEVYLKSLDDRPGRGLYAKLKKAGLFDLASVPWILVRMLSQVRRNIEPRSRTGVLENLAHEMLARIPNNKGLRARAPATLRALAWESQRSRRTTLEITRVLEIMDQTRGNRGYLPEDLLGLLMEQRILAPVGDDHIRFAYPDLQAWFAARALHSLPRRDETLDDITATLGRLSRARWWENTLVLLAGGMEQTDPLLHLILYGGRITEGERLFLATRCLLEAGPRKVSRALRKQLVNALIWLSGAANEPLITRRERAIHALGRLRATSALPHLVRIVLEPTRTDWQGEFTYEYSSVRLAAVEALRNMTSATSDYVIEHYPEYTGLLEAWFRQDTASLDEYLNQAPATHRTIAAFALGNIGTLAAADVLLRVFRQPGIASATRWAITDALLRMEPMLVTNGAILPFLDETAARESGLPGESWKKRQHWYERIAYLIGHINPGDPRVYRFIERCLFKYSGVWLKARAIRSIGAIVDPGYKSLLEEIATGDFGRIKTGRLKAREALYLRSVAIDALAGIGDRNTLTLLQQRDDWSNPALQAAYYRTTEEINWRLFEQTRSTHPSDDTRPPLS